MKFCPLCGKKTETLMESFCEDCFKEKYDPKFKLIKIKECKVCQRVLQKNKWDKVQIEEVIKKQIKETEKHAQLEQIKENQLTINIHGASFIVPFQKEFSSCGICKPSKTYFEGILQLRDSDKKVIDFAREEIAKVKQKGVLITKEAKQKNGIDLYLTDKKYLQALGRKLQEEFGGVLKIAPQLFSMNRQTGKEVYRVNVFFRPIDFKKGDTIEVSGEKIKVTSVDKEVFGTDEKGRKVHIPTEKLGNYKVL